MSPSDEEIKKCKGPTKGKNKAGEDHHKSLEDPLDKELATALEIQSPSSQNDKLDLEQVVENGDGCVDVLSEVAMNNAYLICHNVQDLMYFRGFYWEGAEKKGKGKKKKR